MPFARFNQCQPCCDCQFHVSYGSVGGGISGITVTVRDIRGSGVGSCVTGPSGCNISIPRPGRYYAHNSFCNTTQPLDIIKCGNDVNIVIPNILLTLTVNSECFFDVPVTEFDLTGPGGFSFHGEASGNVLVGSLPFPQLAARAFISGTLPSGTYTLTASDAADNHWPSTVSSPVYCSPKDISTYMLKKWGYNCAPGANIDGCPAPGIVISDTDGHSATTDANGQVNDKWKYDLPDVVPTGIDDDWTFIKMVKSPYIEPGYSDPRGLRTSKGRCSPEPADCSSAGVIGPTLTTPPGFWGSPSDECLETIPATLNASFTGFTVGGHSTVVVTRGSFSFPYNYNYTNPDLPGFSFVNVGVHPGCRKDASTGVGTAFFAATDGGAPFPANSLGWTYQIIGTSACPTLISFIEYNSFTGVPTGRSATVSA